MSGLDNRWTMMRKVSSPIEYVAESTTACLVTMLQGNLLAVTTGHLLIASQTGIISGAIATVAIVYFRVSTHWIVAAMLGAATSLVDFFVHPSQLGPIATEALVTGLGAMFLSYAIGTALKFATKLRATTGQYDV